MKRPQVETAQLAGTLGVRLAGGRLQLRVDAQVHYSRPDDDIEPQKVIHPKETIQGQLVYEGPAPEHALLFAAPLDDHTQQIVLFTVKKVKEEPPAATR